MVSKKIVSNLLGGAKGKTTGIADKALKGSASGIAGKSLKGSACIAGKSLKGSESSGKKIVNKII